MRLFLHYFWMALQTLIAVAVMIFVAVAFRIFVDVSILHHVMHKGLPDLYLTLLPKNVSPTDPFLYVMSAATNPRGMA